MFGMRTGRGLEDSPVGGDLRKELGHSAGTMSLGWPGNLLLHHLM